MFTILIKHVALNKYIGIKHLWNVKLDIGHSKNIEHTFI